MIWLLDPHSRQSTKTFWSFLVYLDSLSQYGKYWANKHREARTHLISADMDETFNGSIFPDRIKKLDKGDDVVFDRLYRIAVATSWSTISRKMHHRIDLLYMNFLTSFINCRYSFSNSFPLLWRLKYIPDKSISLISVAEQSDDPQMQFLCSALMVLP